MIVDLQFKKISGYKIIIPSLKPEYCLTLKGK